MTQNTIDVGRRSPDGRYEWSGTEWVPVHQETRPQQRGLHSWAGALDSVTSEDLYFGQTVIVWARWILIATGLLLSFWSPQSLTVAEIQFAAIIALAFGNFYLHVQLLRGHPSLDMVVYGASLADLSVITALVAAQGGFTSQVFVFYFAAVLGFSVAFPTILTALYSASAISFYALLCLAAMPVGDYPALFVRLLMIAAVAVCGNLFARSERSRREEAAEHHEELLGGARAGDS
jgi:hypothetical protein